MSGQFTGLKYDPAAYSEAVNRSTNQLTYRLDPNYVINCGRCIPNIGTSQFNKPELNNKIDVDSILRGYTKIKSKSNQEKLPDSIKSYNITPLPSCDSKMEPIYTRYDHPVQDVKGKQVDDLRLSYPLHDPQCNIFERFDVDTRLQAKDNHRANWQMPMDQSGLLPTEKLGKNKRLECHTSCKFAPY